MHSISKKLVTILIAFGLLATTFAPNALASEPTLGQQAYQRLQDAVVLYLGSNVAMANGQWESIDSSNPAVKPLLRNARTMVPIRFVAESLGADVSWDPALNSVAVNLNGESIVFRLGRYSAWSWLKKGYVRLDVAPFAQNGRAYIPLRAVSELLGMTVFYDRDLITVSPAPVLNAVSDRAMINEAIRWFTVTKPFGTRSYDFNIVDAAADPAKPLIYYVTENGDVSVFDGRTGTTKTIYHNQATLAPHIFLHGNTLVLGATYHELSMEYSRDSRSALTFFDTTTLRRTREVLLDFRMQDMTMDESGFIYVAGGDGTVYHLGQARVYDLRGEQVDALVPLTEYPVQLTRNKRFVKYGREAWNFHESYYRLGDGKFALMDQAPTAEDLAETDYQPFVNLDGEQGDPGNYVAYVAPTGEEIGRVGIRATVSVPGKELGLNLLEVIGYVGIRKAFVSGDVLILFEGYALPWQRGSRTLFQSYPLSQIGWTR